MTEWDGTLDQHGQVEGNITFNQGSLELGATPVLLTASYTPTANQPLYLNNSNTFLNFSQDQISKRIFIAASGVHLQGSPIFADDTMATPNIELKNSSASAHFAFSADYGGFIKPNGGTIILDSDFRFAKGKRFVGTGTVDANGKRIIFGGDFNGTGTILFQSSVSTNIALLSKMSLSGLWRFKGTNCYINGQGNTFDLGTTGTLWIKSGTTLSLDSVILTGLGNGKGSIVFEDKTSQLRISNSQIILSNNYSVTQGGMYINGPTTIVTDNKKITFALMGSLTVNNITLWYDTLTQPNANNVAGTLIKNITTLNDGQIVAAPTAASDSTIVRTTSNALLFCCKNTSNALLFGDKNNSNALIKDIANLRTNSNSDLFLFRTYSNAFARGIRNNSNAITVLANNNTLLRNTSNALLFCCKNTSNAIITLGNLARTTSNAMLAGDKNNSNALIKDIANLRTNSNSDLFLFRTYSNAFARGIRNNSNAITVLANNNTLLRNTSNALLFCCKNSSNAIVNLGTLVRTTSNAMLAGDKNNSNALVKDITNLRTTSNALLFCCKNTSNAIVTLGTLVRTTSNAMLFGDKNNSNTLLYLNRTSSNAFARGIRNNSNAILNSGTAVRTTSNALLFCCKNTSNALIKDIANLRTNSNSDLFLFRTYSNAFARGIRNNSNAITVLANNNTLLRNTSNALLFCCKNTSNAIVALGTLVRTTSNAMLAGDKNNSNALVKDITNLRTTSNALLFCCKNTSNALIKNINNVRTISNAMLAGDKNNSNTLLYLTRTYSNAFAFGIKNNSNAIITGGGTLARATSNALLFCCKNTSNALLAGNKNNSNALLYLNRVNSNALNRGLANNSNALLKNAADIRTTSNALVFTKRKPIIYDVTHQSLNTTQLFNDITEISLFSNQVLSTTWTFSGPGNTLLGNGNILDLSKGTIIIERGSSLALVDVVLQNVSQLSIICLDNASSLTLQNAVWIPSNNYTFSLGILQITGEVQMHGPYTFAYQSIMTCTIQDNSTWFFDYGMTLSYDPTIPRRNLISFQTSNAALYLKGATLYTTPTGLQLTGGTLLIDEDCLFCAERENNGFCGSIELGAQDINKDMFCRLIQASRLEIALGDLIYSNQNPASWHTYSSISNITVDPSCCLRLKENLNIEEGIVYLSTQGLLLSNPGKTLNGSVLTF